MWQLWILNPQQQFEPVGQPMDWQRAKSWLAVLTQHFDSSELQLLPEGTPV